MKDILFSDGTETMSEALGISEKRAKKLHYRMSLFIHELFRPTESGAVEWEDSQILKAFLGLAETDEERVYCAFAAGRKVEELSGNNEIYYEEDEE